MRGRMRSVGVVKRGEWKRLEHAREPVQPPQVRELAQAVEHVRASNWRVDQ